MSALPNLFEFVIDEALAQASATAESVALAIATSDPFLKCVRKGIDHQESPENPRTKSQVMRIALAKAFEAGTAGGMD